VHTSAQKHKDMKPTQLTLFLPEDTIAVDKQVNSHLLSRIHSISADTMYQTYFLLVFLFMFITSCSYLFYNYYKH